MVSFICLFSKILAIFSLALGSAAWASTSLSSSFDEMGLKLAIAEVISEHDSAFAFYKARGYSPLWTGSNRNNIERRAALLNALSKAKEHGLSTHHNMLEDAYAYIEIIENDYDHAKAEIALTHLFLNYAQAVKFGTLNPSKINKTIGHKQRKLNITTTLDALANKPAPMVFKTLFPQSIAYSILLKEKHRFEKIITEDSWGQDIPTRRTLHLNAKGRDVVLLRDRLITLGFLEPTATMKFDENIRNAVLDFQKAHGLDADGIAGRNTFRALNVPPKRRIAQITTAMERQRWIDRPDNSLYIWVNLAAAEVQLIKNGKANFSTRAIIGHSELSRQSSEFSDEMTHMIVNPTWNVPHSIATKEYLPILKENPKKLTFIEIFDKNGVVIDRKDIDFNAYNEKNFPYLMRQLPSLTNALGRVKFMFPNKYSIYLHDTPEKELFYRQNRTYSHGCIRLHRPFEFGYKILAERTKNPVALFQKRLDTAKETRVDLARPIPIYIVYETVTVNNNGSVTYYSDLYERDNMVINALYDAGVDIPLDIVLENQLNDAEDKNTEIRLFEDSQPQNLHAQTNALSVKILESKT